MPGANCSIFGCNTSRKHKGISIFKVPKAKNERYKVWRKDWLQIITRTHVVDESLSKQINNDSLHVCEKHFKEEDVQLGNSFFTLGLFTCKILLHVYLY